VKTETAENPARSPRERVGQASESVTHGTATAWRHGCRCDECSSVHAASARAWREQNHEQVEARNRQRREEYEPVTDTVRTWTCRSCGTPIVSSGWRRWTCDDSKRSAERAREARKRARRGEGVPR
jgi:hypothetical protein